MTTNFGCYLEEYEVNTDTGWSMDEIEEGTLPYYIDSYSSVAGNNITYILLFIGGILCLIWAVCRIVKGTRGGFLNKLRQDILEAGYTESSVESDYNNAFSMRKNDVIKIGRLMIYYEIGSLVRAIPTNKIMWAYQHTTTHRTNGIKTGTTYSVIIFSDTKNGKVELTANNQENALEILSRINTMFPWVVIGYTDELAKMFNKNRAEFMNIRYNSCEHVAVEPGFEGFASFDSAAQ